MSLVSSVDNSAGYTQSPSSSAWSRLARAAHATIPRWIPLACSLFFLQVLVFELLRVVMLLRNHDISDGASPSVIARSFLVGLRFDMAVVAIANLPLLLAARIGSWFGGSKAERWVSTWSHAIVVVVAIFLGLAECEFYREFHTRYNTLVVEYAGHSATALSMIWNGYPVARYLAVWVVMSAACVWVIVKAGRFWLPSTATPGSPNLWLGTVATVLAVVLFGLVARGGIRGTPLQWGDAIHSDSTFANQLTQNGCWTLGRSLLSLTGKTNFATSWKATMDSAEARQRVQQMLCQPHEEPVGDGSQFPLLRRNVGGPRTVSLRPVADQPPNVVVILMESFSARFVGAVGSDNDRTPEFNRLAEHGILFDRCFSNGSHTHQALYGVGAGFPNLPGYACLLETTQAEQRFDTLAGTFRKRGYETMFLYNGDFAWDNMQGFFSMQGMNRFIGRDDFPRSSYRDPTWGVSDKELFERANQEFKQARSPFFATILTLSNHTPFKFPRPLPFPEVTDAGDQNDQMNGMRFADYSVGHFIELARREAYFRNTLFVLVGDHGFSVKPILTELGLLRFHVPLLFYAPELLGDERRVRHTVASHVCIAPTVLGLMQDTDPHQHWGRDLFTLAEDDPGFAMLKQGSSAPDAGYVAGDRLLVQHAGGKSQLYDYSLGFPPRVTPIDPPDREVLREMQTDLRAFIQTGLEVLLNHHVAQ